MSVQHLFNNFYGKRILVVGDLMLDAYIIGNVSRISPEAPVPVLDKTSSDYRLGGAGNVALNLKSLGAIPIIASVIGKDAAGEIILNQLKINETSSSCMLITNERRTTVKTRVIANNQQVIRIDEEQTDDINSSQATQLLDLIKKEIIQGLDAIIFQDYNKGVLTEKLIADLIELALKNDILTSVDPKNKNFLTYKGVTLFKPNLKEIKEGLNVIVDPKNLTSLENTSLLLEEKLNNKITFITLSEHGVFIKDRNQHQKIEAHIRKIADVSGAGDSVIATATLCLVAGADSVQMAEISNIAGGLACEKAGVHSISLTALKEECLKLLQ